MVNKLEQDYINKYLELKDLRREALKNNDTDLATKYLAELSVVSKEIDEKTMQALVLY